MYIPNRDATVSSITKPEEFLWQDGTSVETSLFYDLIFGYPNARNVLFIHSVRPKLFESTNANQLFSYICMYKI